MYLQFVPSYKIFSCHLITVYSGKLKGTKTRVLENSDIILTKDLKVSK